MSGFFIKGEKKDRPGIYHRIENAGGFEIQGAREGIAAVVGRGTWGPLNVASVIDASADLVEYFGTGQGMGTAQEVFLGGAKTVVAVRVGSGGECASVVLKDTGETPANVLTVSSKYPGTYPLSISIKTSLIDRSVKEVKVYSDTAVLETRKIDAGTGEVDAFVEAFADSSYINARKDAAGNGTLAEVSQTVLTGGVDPVVTNAAYSNAFDIANSETFDVLCVDTDATDVHALVQAFVDRIYQGGDFPMAVISEPKSVSLETRMLHASAYDDEKIIYVLNGFEEISGSQIEGYLVAARVCGMVTAINSNDSLTHKQIERAVSLLEPLTDTQIIKAIRNGCFVISKSATGTIRCEKAINTLHSITKEKDQGWKKIRRTKTRFELIYRIEATLDEMIGDINNDPDGRAAIIAAAQQVMDTMVAEGKLLPGGTFTVDPSNPPQGDSAWFIIATDDVDSFETGYLTFRYRFAPEEEEET